MLACAEMIVPLDSDGANPSWWTKFLWHGVDISVAVVSNAISAGIVALVAWFTWELKNKRDTKSALERNEKLARQTEMLGRHRAISESLQRLVSRRVLLPEMLGDLDNLVFNITRDEIKKTEPFSGFWVWWQSAEPDVRRVAPVRPGDPTKEAIWLELKRHLGPMHEAFERIRAN